ncbi:putative DDE superfamily endonuclease [Lyophyllum shimeji]|uniref:DDE superfamily endonuclease n=1 Tax=Lyophyllum shimeji TaxID=47721 RepID=A0A9P3PYW5_LYOSH|nr:putative DDE superfamily endonuclease [Lyophyllum shimeji]
MVYRAISANMKQQALQLLDSGWEIEDIADALGVSTKSIGCWAHNYETHRRIDPPSVLQGRPRLLGPKAVEDLQELIQESPSFFLDEIREWLALYHDQPISITALHDNLRELGLTYKLCRRAATERNDAERSEWMYYVTTNFTADQMVILNESSKDEKTLVRHYVHTLCGDNPVLNTSLDWGVCYSVLPALTIDGYIAVRVVEGSIDGAEFYDFVVNDVLPCMNPFPGPGSVLMLDNYGTHKSDAVHEAVEASGCLLLFLPPYSPDYSPIEESFSCLKHFLRRHYIQFQNRPSCH